jgi:hypothetical protein
MLYWGPQASPLALLWNDFWPWLFELLSWTQSWLFVLWTQEVTRDLRHLLLQGTSAWKTSCSSVSPQCGRALTSWRFSPLVAWSTGWGQHSLHPSLPLHVGLRGQLISPLCLDQSWNLDLWLLSLISSVSSLPVTDGLEIFPNLPPGGIWMSSSYFP